MQIGLSSFTDDRLATFGPNTEPSELHDFLDRFGLEGNPERGKPDIEVDYLDDGSFVVIWWLGDPEYPALTLNDKARIYCREYLKGYPDNEFAKILEYWLAQPDFPPLETLWETLEDLIQTIRLHEE
tara:strand:+ start:652 stop:1032 length:381 start_codon:yes stop_codon:yes gene_type:complete